MKLYHVRKGQFVYYHNELHRVYGVKPLYKQSVHLIRLRDLTQNLTTAANVEKYKPQQLDCFTYNHKIYTLRKDRNAEPGDYILITNPTPDSLDHYSLNEIEVVETVDHKGVITSNSNGIKHNEYLLMVPGRSHNSRQIDYLEVENMAAEDLTNLGTTALNQMATEPLPILGDVYKTNENGVLIEAMVVAIQGQTVFLGNGLEVPQEELMNTEKWTFLYNLNEK
ncbi:hypothetical protein [uncultured Metabacillus sp.]|uniref:hypothetical protein n=1 Tax=uncultured Metabacillus sp. TaxID=2860135 RepID=UPI00261BCB0E|nr:hypothetical protein [uncultured Metabacillus sp.]